MSFDESVSQKQQAFRLESQPAILVAAAIAVLLFIYFLTDTFALSPWRYASTPPVLAFIACGVLATLIGLAIGRKAPLLERLTIALLLGGMVGAALWPAALRVNAATAEAAPEPVLYERVEAGVYQAVTTEHPELTFYGHQEYWAHPSQNERRRFHLQQGRLGFWQVDYDRIRDDMSLYYSILEDLNGEQP